MISVHFQGKPFNITLIQVYAPTNNAEEAEIEQFYEDLYQCVLLAKFYEPLHCFILYSKAKFACYSRCFFTSYFCVPVPYNEKEIVSGC